MSTIPSLALIPSGYKGGSPKGTLYSVLPTDGTGDFDFTRSGNATRVNSEGLIESVSSNVPRLNYPLIDGVVQGCPSLFLEPQRLQLIQYSEDFSQGYWIKQSSTITSNSIISPDGTLNADLYTTSSATFDFIQTTGSFIVSGYSFSIFAKKGTSDKIDLALTGAAFTDTRVVRFDLTNKTTETLGGILSSKIEEYPNGWFRCSIYAVTNAVGSGTIRILSGSTDNVSTLYIWGAQVEQGYLTSYIPNYGTALGVTRSAETCNNAGDVNTFNDSEGVLFAEISTFDDTSVKAITLGDGTSSNRIQFFYFNGASIYGACIVGGVSQASIFTNIDVSSNIKVAFKYKVNDFALWVNGFKVGIDTNGTVPTGLNTLRFDNGVGGSNLDGSTKQIQYFDTALSDEELALLTSL